MSYESIEAKLMANILELRACEDALVRSYAQLLSEPCDRRGSAFSSEHARVSAKLAELERLLMQMESAEESVPFVPAAMSVAQIPAFQA